MWHHDREPQYTATQYTKRLAEAGIAASVGSVGSSYDNALAETISGLCKTELIKPRGPWRTLDLVEIATAEWVDWFNHRRRVLRRHSPGPSRDRLLRSPHGPADG